MDEKTSYLQVERLGKKNQISRYHISSPAGMIKKIQDRSIKNLLTQWDIEKENQKILSVFGEKLHNLGKKQGRKTGKDQVRKRFKTFLFV